MLALPQPDLHTKATYKDKKELRGGDEHSRKIRRFSCERTCAAPPSSTRTPGPRRENVVQRDQFFRAQTWHDTRKRGNIHNPSTQNLVIVGGGLEGGGKLEGRNASRIYSSRGQRWASQHQRGKHLRPFPRWHRNNTSGVARHHPNKKRFVRNKKKRYMDNSAVRHKTHPFLKIYHSALSILGSTTP